MPYPEIDNKGFCLQGVCIQSIWVIYPMANIKDLLKIESYDSIRSILISAGELGQKENVEVYVVGGFVRDLLMGRPINDIDIMIVGEGIPFAKKLAVKLGKKKVIPFKKFGTALIPNNDFQISRIH